MNKKVIIPLLISVIGLAACAPNTQVETNNQNSVVQQESEVEQEKEFVEITSWEDFDALRTRLMNKRDEVGNRYIIHGLASTLGNDIYINQQHPTESKKLGMQIKVDQIPENWPVDDEPVTVAVEVVDNTVNHALKLIELR